MNFSPCICGQYLKINKNNKACTSKHPTINLVFQIMKHIVEQSENFRLHLMPADEFKFTNQRCQLADRRFEFMY